jgi:hypothetical protein
VWRARGIHRVTVALQLVTVLPKVRDESAQLRQIMSIARSREIERQQCPIAIQLFPPPSKIIFGPRHRN